MLFRHASAFNDRVGLEFYIKTFTKHHSAISRHTTRVDKISHFELKIFWVQCYCLYSKGWVVNA